MSTSGLKKDFNNIVPLSDIPKILPIAEKTLRNWRSKRWYPNIWLKLGGKVFIDIDELSKIIEEQKEKTIKDMRRLGL